MKPLLLLLASAAITCGVTLTPTQDTDVYQFTTYPTSTTYSLGVNASNGEGHSQKTLLKFNPTTTTLGMSATEIGTAKLRLYILPDGSPSSGYGGTLVPGAVTVHPQGTAWTVATARWSTFSPGTSLGSIAITQPSTETTAVWVELDVTAQVKAWVTTPSTNNGFVIQSANENAVPLLNVAFASMETGFPPQLVVEKVQPKPFQMTGFTMSGANVTLGWNSVVGKSYRVEESPDMTTWAPRQTVVASSTESSLTIAKTVYAGGKGFFRVVAVQ
ncbi:DNRLRE domain-containing protein [Luteolibacter ambystomatis]|uniref:DNRLRE domain-containing protein n=1 Tax=Luteolibacter ambystomatis TaxID=2824561 RepID=A0A975J0K1_9BACT|nr:DNRLRE domain-containing protein [Luteolibacter ambystomatis]QUE51796.1 DNRLRE domain-containing protein [Luteolibacter ambystomatis]